jgi:hypothetical protein
METSEGLIRGNVDSLTKLIAALDSVGIELIGDGAVSSPGGRGVRLKKPAAVSRESPERGDDESATPALGQGK